MYIPEIYKNNNQQEVENFIIDNGFGIVVSQNNSKISATHVPLILKENNAGQKILEGHVSKSNPQGQNFTTNESVLAIFSGPNAYISSSWYDHENVPTYNYIAVHVYGKIKILNYDETVKSLKTLVDKYEQNVTNPIRVENLSKKTMLEARGIIGFQIEITSIEATKKLSQNRDEKNYNAIVAELEKTSKITDQLLANEMKKCPF